jgi:YVTN family beta-propeller protein
MHERTRTCLILLVAWSVAGCPPSSADDDDSMVYDDDDGADDDDATLPPEDEIDFLVTEPTGTDRYLFVANPARDSISRIDVQTRQVDTVEVGDEPTRVVVSADFSRAVAFCAGSDTVSIIDTGSLETVELPVREDFNYLEISPDGRWAVAWFNADAEEADFDIEGVRSFTEVSFVDTEELVAHSFSVGHNPKQVLFTEGDQLAVVVSDEHLTTVDLTVDPVSPLPVDLETDLEDPPVIAEVVVSPEGRWTFVRHHGLNIILAIDLATGELGGLDAGLDPTDMDLSEDGLRLYVVARGSSEIRVFDATEPLDAPPTVHATPTTSTLGSLVLVPGGELGLLFTTATLEDRFTTWDLTTDEMTERLLVKPVRAVAASPDGASALVVHTLADVEGADDLFADAYAMTVVDVVSWITNPVGLERRPRRWSTTPDGRYSMFIMDDNLNVGVIDYVTRLVDDVSVPSMPLFLGMLPLDEGAEQNLGWVSQDHDIGRISFVRPSDLSVETVTGFELNSGID